MGCVGCMGGSVLCRGLHVLLWSQIFALMGAQSLALGCFPAPRSSCEVDVFPGVKKRGRCLMGPASSSGDFGDSHGDCH